MEGYRPKDGIKSAVCHSDDSFDEISLPVFECEGKLSLSYQR